MKIIKIPFSKGGLGKTAGCELAPDRIVDNLDNFYLNEAGFKPIFDIEELKVDQDNIETTNENIQTKISQLKEKAILLGGDHSITYATFKAFAKNNPGAGLIILDAHPDCESDVQTPSHEDFLRSLIHENIVPKEKVILIGIRNWDGPEKEFLEANNIRYFSMKKITLNTLHDIIDTITETARNWPSVYLSIDIDVADPAFAPGTGYQEPGGLSSRELVYAIQRFKLLKNLKLADIVEINPKKDINDTTSILAAKLVVELS